MNVQVFAPWGVAARGEKGPTMSWVSLTVSVDVAQLVTVLWIFSNGESWALTGGFAVTCTEAHGVPAVSILGAAASELAGGRTIVAAIAALAAPVPINSARWRILDVALMTPPPFLSVNDRAPPAVIVEPRSQGVDWWRRISANLVLG
jgi:hypothetical protein